MTELSRESLVQALPYARRYARALSGSQPRGDACVAAALTALLDDPSQSAGLPAPHALYRLVTKAQDAFGSTPTGALAPQQRQLLLLNALEGLTIDDACRIVGVDPAGGATLLAEARQQLRAASATDVLIIEDEPIIAMDIEELVLSCGHRVIGVATTETEAVEMAEKQRPGLILADINLGAGGDGTSAVARIIKRRYAPVIFVTAYPERLLTGDALEPAFVITKPFEPMALAIATYQAVSGGVHFD